MSRSRFWFDNPPAPNTFTQAFRATALFGHVKRIDPTRLIMRTGEAKVGTPDLVDVTYDIKEGLPGQFSGGIGYSESQGAILSGSFVHSNFMGSGERVAAEIAGGEYSKVYSFSHTDPYTNIDGVARTIGLQYRDITQYVSSASDFSTKTYSATLEFGYPISEFQAVRWGLVAQRSDLITNEFGSAAEAVYWVQNNGNPYTRDLVQPGHTPA